MIDDKKYPQLKEMQNASRVQAIVAIAMRHRNNLLIQCNFVLLEGNYSVHKVLAADEIDILFRPIFSFFPFKSNIL